MRVRIGLTSGWEQGTAVSGWPLVYVNKGLVEKIEKAGGLPIVIPMLDNTEVAGEYMELIDGLIVSGEIMSMRGDTFARGGEEVLKRGNPLRYDNEEMIIRAAVKRSIPVLGICRGHQMINVVEGGTMKQEDITENNEITHRPALLPEIPVHEITLARGTILGEMLKTSRLKVNSFHRQAVDRVPPGYRVSARAEDGNIEAMERDTPPLVLGLQFHPEMLRGEIWDNFFREFIERVKRDNTKHRKL